MAWQIASPNIGTGVRHDLPNLDDLFVPEGITIGSTDNDCVTGFGSGHHILVLGTIVSANDLAVALGDTPFDDSGNQITVEASGRIQGLGNNETIYIRGYQNLVINRGIITSEESRAIVINGDNLVSESVINNSGLMQSTGQVIFKLSAGNEAIRLINTGTIKGVSGSFVDGNTTASNDHVINTGTMIGDCEMGAGNDDYRGSGSLIGVLRGEEGNDTLTTAKGNNRIDGGINNDTLNGGIGRDTLTGGPNNDFFVFNAPIIAANRDTVTDFNPNQDTIRLENAVFNTVGGNGLLRASAFKLSTQAKDADDRIIYNTTSGALSFDRDGSGSAAAVQFATLTGSPNNVTFRDFFII